MLLELRSEDSGTMFHPERIQSFPLIRTLRHDALAFRAIRDFPGFPISGAFIG
jgi:hypothetical protein